LERRFGKAARFEGLIFAKNMVAEASAPGVIWQVQVKFRMNK
jgi:hypothetical protein